MAVIAKLTLTAYNVGMKRLRSGVLLSFIAVSVSLSACARLGSKTSDNAPTNAVNHTSESKDIEKTNVEELALLISVPYQTEDIVWKLDAEHKKVVAVFRFSPEDAGRVVAEASKFGHSQGVSIETETWFPDELMAQGDLSGDNALKGTAFPANNFFQEPYTSGRIVRIEGGDYFVLELTSK
jgi:hypothetical protein